MEFAPYLGEAGEYDAYVKTFPWFNGRERGFAVVLFREEAPIGPCLILACAECKSSDDIYIIEWEQEQAPRNGPTLESLETALGADKADEVWAKRQTFSQGRIGAVVNYMYDRMATFYKEKPPKTSFERLMEDD